MSVRSATKVDYNQEYLDFLSGYMERQAEKKRQKLRRGILTGLATIAIINVAVWGIILIKNLI
jgi:hypothetical protein